MDKIYSSIANLEKENKSAVLCIIVDSQGSTPRKAGSKMLVFQDGSSQGTVGGGRIEYLVIDEAQKMIGQQQAKSLFYDLDGDVGMQCGGKMTIYFEPINSPYRLLIFGAGHIGKVLAKMAGNYGFQVSLIDDREELFAKEMEGVSFVSKSFPEAYEQMEFRPKDFVVVTTYKHVYDEEIVSEVLKQPVAYLGMMASKRKAALARKKWASQGFSQENIDQVYSPVGVDIKCETPEEIALSIMAQLVHVMNALKKKNS